MDLTIILTAIGTVVAVVGSNVALISWLRSDMKSFVSEVRHWREELHQDSKEFHGKLERHDAEFKAHLIHCHKSGEKA